MAGVIRAVAVDLDGTIAENDHVASDTMAALKACQEGGLATVLVTGRITEDVDHHFPGLRDCFDAVVSENGAVIETADERLTLTSGLGEALKQRLCGQSEEYRCGHAIIDCDAAHAEHVLNVIDELAVDAQLLRNRSRLMVLPSGVSKGAGLRTALRSLGLSTHNTLAVGDAQNDLSLLDAAEIGVAVANAVSSLKQAADLVLPEADGAGVRALLAGRLVDGTERLLPRRRRIRVGRFTDGTEATVPAAQANILIQGASGVGKSHLAGLLIERWIAESYSVVVIDAEGDYHGLGQLPQVVLIDMADQPKATELVALMRQLGVSLVLDLSQLPAAVARERADAVLDVLGAERAAWGVPHWTVIDEAHASLCAADATSGFVRPADRGLCLVTYRPDDLDPTVRDSIDIRVTVADSAPADTTGVLSEGERTRTFKADSRRTPHVRHLRKYMTQPLPPHRWFRFTDAQNRIVASADSISDFVQLLGTLDPSVVGRHMMRGDLSRWLSTTIQDKHLAVTAAAIERDVVARHTVEVDNARAKLVDAIEIVYQADDG